MQLYMIETPSHSSNVDEYRIFMAFWLFCRFEGLRGFYKGITPNILKNVPASSITFIVYENVMKLLRLGRTKE